MKALYNDLLGRDGEAGGVTYWSNLLKTGVGRDVVAMRVILSEESYGLAVNSFYANYLQRGASGPENQYWLNQYASNAQPLAGVALAFLDSAELYGRASQTVG